MASKETLIDFPAPGFLYFRLGLPEEIRNSLISELLSDSQKSSKGRVGAEDSQKSDLQIRDVNSIQYNSPNRKLFEDFIQGKINSLIQSYRWGKNKKVVPCNGWGYFLYKAPEGHYDWHCDEGHVWPNGNIVINYPCRHLTAVYYPNSNYEGGQIEIGERFYGASFQPDSNMIKPEFDHILLFPSDIRFPHKVHPVIFGDRISIVNWFDIK